MRSDVTLAAMEKAVARPDRFEGPFDDAYQKVAPEFAAELTELAAKLGPAPFLADLRACDGFDVMDRLGEIAVPTLDGSSMGYAGRDRPDRHRKRRDPSYAVALRRVPGYTQALPAHRGRPLLARGLRGALRPRVFDG